MGMDIHYNFGTAYSHNKIKKQFDHIQCACIRQCMCVWVLYVRRMYKHEYTIAPYQYAYNMIFLLFFSLSFSLSLFLPHRYWRNTKYASVIEKEMADACFTLLYPIHISYLMTLIPYVPSIVSHMNTNAILNYFNRLYCCDIFARNKFLPWCTRPMSGTLTLHIIYIDCVTWLNWVCDNNIQMCVESSRT